MQLMSAKYIEKYDVDKNGNKVHLGMGTNVSERVAHVYIGMTKNGGRNTIKEISYSEGFLEIMWTSDDGDRVMFVPKALIVEMWG